MTRSTMLLGILLTLGAVAAAETVRGPVVDIVVVEPGDLEGTERVLELDEILAVEIDADRRFLQGIELEVHVPAAVRNQPGSVAVSGLVSLTPRPERRVMSLRGARILHEPLLRTQRIYFQLPVYPDAELRNTADTQVLDQIVPPESFPLALTFTDIAKGGAIPRESTSFAVRVRPVVRDLGAVSLRLRTERGDEVFAGEEELADVILRIDGAVVDSASTEVVLPTGLHTIELDSETYLESSQTFGVERGRVTELSVPLVRPKAVVRLDAPRGAEVFVDGQKVGESVVELPEGEHTALVRIGDYSVSRRFTVTRKKSYIISVSLDIIVNEIE